MAQHSAEATLSISIKDLDSMIRRAVRGEISLLVQKREKVFFVEAGTPLYKDLTALSRQKKKGKVYVYSREETFGNE